MVQVSRANVVVNISQESPSPFVHTHSVYLLHQSDFMQLFGLYSHLFTNYFINKIWIWTRINTPIFSCMDTFNFIVINCKNMFYHLCASLYKTFCDFYLHIRNISKICLEPDRVYSIVYSEEQTVLELLHEARSFQNPPNLVWNRVKACLIIKLVIAVFQYTSIESHTIIFHDY